MLAYPVSSLVNRQQNHDAEKVEQIKEKRPRESLSHQRFSAYLSLNHPVRHFSHD